MRRRIRRLRRFSWRWTLAFTRKPPGWRTVEGVKYLDCSLKPEGFRASRPRSASNYAWLRTRVSDFYRRRTVGSLIEALFAGSAESACRRGAEVRRTGVSTQRFPRLQSRAGLPENQANSKLSLPAARRAS